jgi:phosphohistidine phosphatase
MRHAKSDWSNPSLSDFDRPLAKRGLKDAPRIGMVLSRLDCMPDIIVSSPSLRTRQTVQLAALDHGYGGEIQWEESLYGGSPYDYISALQSLPEDALRPLLVGHNPGIEEALGVLLTSASQGFARIRMPTAGLALLITDLKRWSDTKPGTCTLRWFVVPKLLKAMT